jgi:hypothetical protein
MPSYDAVNYAIRPNKTVERKIVFSGLTKLSAEAVNLSAYNYIGLGSLWFIDFMMAHQTLGIKSMISIEADPIGYQRSEFNRPLSCIEVVHGETTLTIPDLRLEDRPAVIWFDYDSSIRGPVIEDIGLIVGNCAPNTVLIVTINAKALDLPTKDENDNEIDKETSLRRIAGDLVPTPLPSKRFKPLHYPKLLCDILTGQFQSATLNSGRSGVFIKLFELVYKDGTPMVTVGGIIAAPETEVEIRQLVESPNWKGIVAETIAVPPLTVKEKLALDRFMPSKNPPTDAQMDEIGFRLERDQLATYHRHYLNYPMFGEFYT